MTRAPGPRSRALFRRARRSLVGGVDSPVRSFAAVGGVPVFVRSGRGAYLTDVDGRRYLDFVNSWGANLRGGAPPAVLRAIRAAAADGLSFGAPSPREHELAELLRARVPELGLLRFVNSGTEAVMSAVRVARGVTGRPRIVKFAGGYHGHSDGLLVRAGSGVAAQGLPDSAGVPAAMAAATLVAPYNDLPALERLFERYGSEIAAVLVEPVAANMGVVVPVPGFLAGLGRLARRHGALTIADEVLTGFRLRPGIAAPGLGLAPDLVTLGKIIGGGLPVGAYGGRAAVMRAVAPLGPVYQAGTLSGNPVAMAAGAAVLRSLRPADYARLERRGARLEELLRAAAERERAGPFHVARAGSLLGLFFREPPVRDDAAARTTDRARYARFFHAALDRGLYLPPSPLEALFLSTALSEEAIDRSRPAFEAAFRAARGAGG